MTENNAASGTPGNPVPVQIEAVCANCVHYQKSPQEIGNGICFALPPSVILRGNALIKVRSNMAANERGCTALFTARPEVVELAVAQQMGAANEG